MYPTCVCIRLVFLFLPHQTCPLILDSLNQSPFLKCTQVKMFFLIWVRLVWVTKLEFVWFDFFFVFFFSSFHSFSLAYFNPLNRFILMNFSLFTSMCVCICLFFFSLSNSVGTIDFFFTLPRSHHIDFSVAFQCVAIKCATKSNLSN